MSGTADAADPDGAHHADGLRAFAVRLERPGHGYGWEIRRHGGLLVRKGEGAFPDMAAARSAGEAALAAARAVAPAV